VTSILDPLEATRRIERRYRGYLESTFRPQDDHLRREFERALADDFTLTRGPFLQASAPFEVGSSVSDLVRTGVLHEGFSRLEDDAFPIHRPLYRHQDEAIRKAVVERRNLVVSTGTGSGKTECFLLPIINALLREQEAGTLALPGVRALLLYPMNALANDQVGRLRSLLAGLPEITFGRYVGETRGTDQEAREAFRARHPGVDIQSNERMSREQMQVAPPHILLTNYAMLEYLLLRPDDSALFDGPTGDHWRFLVLDEAHVYGGAQGTEVAMLLRRVKDRVVGSEPNRLQCFATSATLGRGPEDHPALVDFASDLFGERFDVSESAHDVVVAYRRPLAKDRPTIRFDPTDFTELQASFRNASLEGVATVAVRHGLVPPDDTSDLSEWLYDTLGAEEHVVALQRLLESGSVDLGRAAALVFDSTTAESVVVSLVDLCVAARPRSDDAPLIPARYHYFLRSLESGFVCRSPRHPADKPSFLLARHADCPGCDAAGIESSMFELGVCRTCRVEFLVGHREARADGRTVFAPSPPHFGVSEYLLLRSPVDADDDQDAGHDAGTESVVAVRLCTACAAVAEGIAGCSCASPEQVTAYLVVVGPGEVLRTCPVCTSRTQGEIVLRMVTGTDAPASVIATDLFQAIPASSDPRLQKQVGQGRKLLTFSDSRQDAAFFASFLDRTYSRAVERRVLFGAVEQLVTAGTPRAGDVASQARRIAEDAWLIDADRSAIENMSEVGMWVMQELLALDRRQSIEGTGVAEIAVAMPRAWEPPRPLLDLGLTATEVIDLFQVLFETLRASGAVSPPELVDLRHERFEPRNQAIYAREKGSERGVVSWLPASSSVSNRRAEYLTKVFVRRGIDANPIAVLEKIWVHLTQGNGPWGATLVGESPKGIGAVWRLAWDRFELLPLTDDHRPGRCTACRRLFWRSVAGACPGWRCDGDVVRVDDVVGLRSDHYARLFTDIEPYAMEVHEHTAQLTAARASWLQDQFVNGRVNTLSCSTTFELGVDVGEVQAVFLRNVPPTPANYVQRAGRAGRRADSAALVVTFAQRRSHDLTHFDEPTRMVDGHVDPPRIRLENSTIVRRHLHSVAFAAFERAQADAGERHTTVAQFFVAAHADQPFDLAWVEWLGAHPAHVRDALLRLVPELAAKELDVDGWGWVRALVESTPEEPMWGWLRRAGEQARSEIGQLNDLFEEARSDGNGGLMERYKRVRATFERRYLLTYLASKNVLPKYGFPVDVVDFNVLGSGDAGAADLDLSRDLTMAISEYAPGAQIVAAKALWDGIGVATKTGQGWPTFKWAQCDDCGAYRHAIEALPPCEVCGSTTIRSGKTGTVVIPVFGFIGRRSPKRPGDTRPPRSSVIEQFFGAYDDEPDDLTSALDLKGPTSVSFRVSRQGRINVVNRGPRGRGYMLCEWCGYGIGSPDKPGKSKESHDHASRPGKQCKGTLRQRHLGHEYLTDILELRLSRPLTQSEAHSTLYAIMEGAGSLTISGDDIDGSLYTYAKGEAPGLIIFDSVAGGAGHAQRIAENLDQVLRSALARVELCSCGPETSCYTCLRTFRNQRVHEQLSRGAAAQVLRSILEVDAAEDGERSLGYFADEVRPLIRRAIELGAPAPTAGFELDDGSVVDAAWPSQRVGVDPFGSPVRDPKPAGWLIKPIEAWDVDELVARVSSGS
jgi:ATP-dependent helicase YprA (DUF1998 family)